MEALQEAAPLEDALLLVKRKAEEALQPVALVEEVLEPREPLRRVSKAPLPKSERVVPRVQVTRVATSILKATRTLVEAPQEAPELSMLQFSNQSWGT